jgi:AraC-like DNA-binding protein/predicted transcriptional regulator YdeE
MEPRNQPPLAQKQITKAALDFLDTHMLDSELTKQDVAAAAHVSLPYLHRLFAANVGMGVHRYLRMRRLSRAALELRHGRLPILEIALTHGYGSQQSFTEAFEDVFGVAPGEYRRAGSPPSAHPPEPLRTFLHRAAHDAAREGLVSDKTVHTFLIHKPACKVIAKVNRAQTPSDRFYDHLEQSGSMQRLDSIAGVVFSCGMLLSHQTPALQAYIGEVSADYAGHVPAEFELIEVAASEYVVFFHPSYPLEDHGSVLYSAWTASTLWKPEDHGRQWNTDKVPIWEHDCHEGYMIFKPTRPQNAAAGGSGGSPTGGD